MQTGEGIRMELKYCECCGGLLLRRAGSGATYCGDCAVLVGDLAPRRERKRVERATPSGEGRPEAGLRLEASFEVGVHSPQPAVFAAMQWGAA